MPILRWQEPLQRTESYSLFVWAFLWAARQLIFSLIEMNCWGQLEVEGAASFSQQEGTVRRNMAAGFLPSSPSLITVHSSQHDVSPYKAAVGVVYPCQPSNEDILSGKNKKTVQSLQFPFMSNIYAVKGHHAVWTCIAQLWMKHTNQYYVREPLVLIVFLQNMMSFHTLISWVIIEADLKEVCLVQDKGC